MDLGRTLAMFARKLGLAARLEQRGRESLPLRWILGQRLEIVETHLSRHEVVCLRQSGDVRGPCARVLGVVARPRFRSPERLTKVLVSPAQHRAPCEPTEKCLVILGLARSFDLEIQRDQLLRTV